MDVIVKDCKCTKKLNKLSKAEMPFGESIGKTFGFGHPKASIITTKVVTTKINLDSDFFSSNVFSRNNHMQ